MVDRTELNGKYTFILEYDCPACAPLAPKLPVGPDGDSSPADAPSDSGGFPDIFAAVQKQLGLRLVKTADFAMNVIVVETLDKTPTEN